MDRGNLIEITPSLLKGIEVINSVDLQKYQLVLNRIVGCLLQTGVEIAPFTDEELVKLEDTLGLESEEVSLLLNSSTFLLLQCVRRVIPPGVFDTQLRTKLGCNDEKTEVLVATWKTNAKQFVNAKKLKSVYSKQLEDVSWLVNIECATSDKKQIFLPKGVLQLKLKENSERQRLNLEMGEKELTYLYNVLEDVQTSLDSLH